MDGKRTKTITKTKVSEMPTYSKKLSTAITVLFFSVILFAIAVWLFDDRVIPSEILWAVSAPFASVTALYLVKAGIENKAKINLNCEKDGEA